MKKIPLFELVPVPLDADARALPKFKWAASEVGTRHKLGGTPDLLQQEDFPVCICCGDGMSFYGQLDSINDEFCIADCGMVYVFICFACNEVKAIIQSS
ncbi:DUF1963 domain-containing protein [Chitinimonas arctica]|uniref:DUF1963 domain-containing protein n=1 Tax=Chitinimonas arctica TaxID=2594795 RepID=A0A516SCM1_9NEIS|nr:DUF1963 domain-containing protein [Chitinimonas arctica]QDQ25890.1 DUF1963 domain-containing protein [Chitinimonas arctica]